MIRESMIKVLRYKAEHIKTRIKPEFFLKVADALEQQFCEDAISRQDTLKEFKRIYFDNDTVIRCAELVLGGMSSVTPKPKTGHWIRVTDKTGHLVWECDKCGWQQRFNTNFCPDCGARMIDVTDINDGKLSEILTGSESEDEE